MLHYTFKKNPHRPTLILIHGFTLSAHIWDALSAQLEKDYQILCLSLPRTMAEVPPYDQLERTLAEELLRLLKTLGIEKNLHLVGHSMGGYLGLGFLELYPETWQSFTLLNSTCFADSEERKAKRRQAIEHIKNYGGSSFLNQAIPSWIGKTYKEQHPEAVLQLITEANELSGELLVYYQTYMMHRKDRSAFFSQAKLSPKRLILVGEFDPLVAEEDFEGLAHVSVEVLQGVAHMSMIEHPSLTAKHLHQFLSSLSHP